MFFRDLRIGFRILVRNPTFAIPAVTVVALGIGASTAVFTVVRAVLLDPLPYHDPDQLVVFRVDAPGITNQPALTTEEFDALRERTELFADLGTVNDSHANITVGGARARRGRYRRSSAERLPRIAAVPRGTERRDHFCRGRRVPERGCARRKHRPSDSCGASRPDGVAAD